MDKQTYEQIRPFVLRSEWRKLSESCQGLYQGDVEVGNSEAARKEYERNITPHIQKLESVLGTSDKRKSIVPTVTVIEGSTREPEPQPVNSIRGTIMNVVRSFIPEKIPFVVLDDNEPNLTQNYHDSQTNTTHLAIKNNTLGIEIASSVTHEGKHADQGDKKQLTSDEMKIIAVSRALYQAPEINGVHYRVSFLEMQARMAEAQFHLDVFPHLAADKAWDMGEREAFLKECRDVYREMQAGVTAANIKELDKAMIYSLRHTSEDCALLHNVFPGETPKERNQAAAQFMATTGKAMHMELYKAWEKVAKDLQNVIEQLERETTIDRETTIEADESRQFLNSCQEEGIPIVQKRDLVDAPDVIIEATKTAYGMRKAMMQAQLYYNPVLIENNGTYEVGYDLSARKRPYYPETAPAATKDEEVAEQNEPTRTDESPAMPQQDEYDWEDVL